MYSVSDGKVELECPTPYCKESWDMDSGVLCWALTAIEWQKFRSSREKLLELRSGIHCPAASEQDDAEGCMRELGLRRCPKCAAWIEKSSCLGFECHNMTCRCGCKFCYACGALASAGKFGTRASCQCNSGVTGVLHGFIDAEAVLSNYAKYRNVLFSFSVGPFRFTLAERDSWGRLTGILLMLCLYTDATYQKMPFLVGCYVISAIMHTTMWLHDSCNPGNDAIALLTWIVVSGCLTKALSYQTVIFLPDCWVLVSIAVWLRVCQRSLR